MIIHLYSFNLCAIQILPRNSDLDNRKNLACIQIVPPIYTFLCCYLRLALDPTLRYVVCVTQVAEKYSGWEEVGARIYGQISKQIQIWYKWLIRGRRKDKGQQYFWHWHPIGKGYTYPLGPRTPFAANTHSLLHIQSYQPSIIGQSVSSTSWNWFFTFK